MDQRGSHCPEPRLREPPASGTGEGRPAGQEDPFELDSSPGLWGGAADAAHRGGRAPETPWRPPPPRSPGRAGTRPGGEFGWGGAPATPDRRRPTAGSARTETSRGAEGHKPARPAPPVPARAAKAGPTDPSPPRPRARRWQKSYHRDNWLVAAERPQRRGFLILRCRLFLPSARTGAEASDCSPVQGIVSWV